jgi:oleandomycin transport system permease protein
MVDGTRHSLILARRNMVKGWRTPEQLFDVTLQPIVFVLLFVFLFGGAVAGDWHRYLRYIIPGIMVQSVLMASVYTGMSLNSDLATGVFDRFRSLPIARSAALVGAVLGDLVRYVVATVSVVGFGMILGFRITTNPLAAVAAGALVIAMALSLSCVSALIGMLVRTSGAVQGISLMIMLPLSFASSAFVPADTLPSGLRAFVHANPVAHLIEASRGLLLGGPVAVPVLASLAWIAGIAGVFAPLAVRAYLRRT